MEAAPDAAPSAHDRPGAYGLQLPDLAAAAPLLVDAPADWPVWRVGVEVLAADELARGTPRLDMISERRAELQLAGGGWMVADRERASTTLHLATRADAFEIVHPYFSLSAAVAALWRGDLALHAAAVVHGGSAWALLGGKGFGKSSTVAALHDAGLDVLTDDVLVLSEDRALAGPRTVDLRTDAGPRHAEAMPLGVVGARDRWRLAARAVAPVATFRGAFVLRWGSEVTLRPLDLRERMDLLLRNMSLRIPPVNPAQLRLLAGLPMWEVARPQELASLPHTVDAVLGAISG